MKPMQFPLLAIAAMAMLQAQDPRPMTGAGVDNDTGLPLNPGRTTGAPWDNSRPVALMGKVQIAGAGSLEEPVRIERVCSGVAHSEGFTDPRGNFSISLGQDQTAMPDASEPPTQSTITPGMGRVPTSAQLANCDLRAVLPGYRSDTIPLGNRRDLDNPNVGTIFLHRESNVEGLTISATTALAPKNARKAYDKGIEAAGKKKLDEAQKELEKSVAIYPKFAAAWFELGTIYEQRQHPDQASDAYSHSIAADPKYLRPYERLYVFAYRAEKWQECADLTDRILHLDPFDYPEAYYLNAVANLRLNHLDAAEKSARESVKLDTAHRDARANYTLGFILAQKGKYAEAAEFLRAYLTMEPQGKQADEVRKQLGEIEHAAQAH